MQIKRFSNNDNIKHSVETKRLPDNEDRKSSVEIMSNGSKETANIDRTDFAAEIKSTDDAAMLVKHYIFPSDINGIYKEMREDASRTDALQVEINNIYQSFKSKCY